MSGDDSAWVKEASDVLDESTSEQTGSFQITMPYVVLQIMQQLEPNHSVQVNASGSTGLFCCWLSLLTICAKKIGCVTYCEINSNHLCKMI